MKSDISGNVRLSSLIVAFLLGISSMGALADQGAFAPLPDQPDMPNAAQIELGRYLFFDKRLSGDADRSCADCHIPEQGWANSDPLSIG